MPGDVILEEHLVMPVAHQVSLSIKVGPTQRCGVLRQTHASPLACQISVRSHSLHVGGTRVALAIESDLVDLAEQLGGGSRHDLALQLVCVATLSNEAVVDLAYFLGDRLAVVLHLGLRVLHHDWHLLLGHSSHIYVLGEGHDHAALVLVREFHLPVVFGAAAKELRYSLLVALQAEFVSAHCREGVVLPAHKRFPLVAVNRHVRPALEFVARFDARRERRVTFVRDFAIQLSQS